ncbi:flagellar biosynthesis anti-sigma factor FlgM [Helicobacter sp. MIT 05-5293]|uniref:flagellar biosynthesis anti-sigma factor FlgM n=1 Tax=Helicobacter sp. MIT 05-5293 TaxID=1548149 RepID=UPI00051D6DF1|nr:flagellar biosynthesis anti-sigma factor FlgM [Helicobacter sp. MIT 05-5293]TLD81574.1 flagellar biosynthesis anti-sigma factor FlgM [Helicobacter sp. MIT 05-5293]
MINGINTSINASTVINKETAPKLNESNGLKEKEEVQLSRADQIKEQIAKGEYKIDLQQTSEKMASNLLNL